MAIGPADYFSGRAQTYRRESEGWLWGRLRRIELRAVLELLRPREGELILDAGCGGGYYSEALMREGASVVGTDISREMLRQVHGATGLPVFASDLEHAAARPVFDAVASLGALEFCQSPGEAVLGMAGALRSGGGRVVLMLPARGWGARLYRYYHARHGVAITLFSVQELKRMAESAGLRITEARKAGFNHVVRMEPAGEAGMR